MRRWAVALLVLTAACSPAPEPRDSTAVGAEAQKASKPRSKQAKSAGASADSGRAPDAEVARDDADAGPTEPVYRDPPPVVVRRHHVFATLFARAGKRVTLTSLLTTASDTHPDLATGTEVALQFKAKGSTDWQGAARAKVVSIKDKGNRAIGTERQEISVELVSEEPKTKALYLRGARVRLEVDRPEAQ